MGNFIVNWGVNILHKALLMLTGGIYWLGSALYKLFLHLSTMQVFSDEFYNNFAQRIYAVLGVFMLFYLSYALLQALVDPDKFTGKEGAQKIAKNLVTSLVLLGLFPTIFTYAYRLQNYILGSNTIGAIILGTSVIDVDSNNENLMKSEAGQSMLQYGDAMSFLILNTFLNPENCNVNISDGYSWFDLKQDIIEQGEFGKITGLGDAVSEGTDIIGSENVTTCDKTGKAALTYMPIPAIAAGCLFVYLMIGFVIDLGVRVFKLAYYQLIAPIPIIMRIIPSKKDVFQNWVKGVLQTYLEVFIRVGTMYAVVFFISALAGESNVIADLMNQGILGMLAIVVLLFGLLKIAKEIPKMISETLGFKNGGVDLGLKNKGPLGAAISGLGLGIGAGIGNFAVKNTVGRAIGLGGAAVGGVTGALGGAYNALWNKASVADGLAYGFTQGAQKGSKVTNLKGFKDSLQFNNMRQSHYNALGLTGTAGIFGGRNLMEKSSVQLKNDIQNRYNKRNEEIVAEYEKRPEFINEHSRLLSQRFDAQSYVNGNSTFTYSVTDPNDPTKTIQKTATVPRSQIQSYRDGLQNTFDSVSDSFAKERNKQREIFRNNDANYKSIYDAYEAAINANNFEEAEKQKDVMKQYEVEHDLFSDQNTTATYQSVKKMYGQYHDLLKSADDELKFYNEQLEIANKSDADILADTRAEYKKQNVDYKLRTKLVNDEINEKKDRAALEKDENRRMRKMLNEAIGKINTKE